MDMRLEIDFIPAAAGSSQRSSSYHDLHSCRLYPARHRPGLLSRSNRRSFCLRLSILPSDIDGGVTHDECKSKLGSSDQETSPFNDKARLRNHSELLTCELATPTCKRHHSREATSQSQMTRHHHTIHVSKLPTAMHDVGPLSAQDAKLKR